MIDIFKNIVHNENILPNLIEPGVLKINQSVLVNIVYSGIASNFYDMNILRLSFPSYNVQINKIKLPKAVNSVAEAIINFSS